MSLKPFLSPACSRFTSVFAFVFLLGCSDDGAHRGVSDGDASGDQDIEDDAGEVGGDSGRADIDTVSPDADDTMSEPTKCISEPCLILRSYNHGDTPGGFFVVDLAEPGEVSPRYNASYADGERPTPSVAHITSAGDALIWEQTSADYESVDLVRVAHDAPGVEVPVIQDYTGGFLYLVPNSDLMLGSIEKSRGSVLREVFSFVPEEAATLNRLHPELDDAYISPEFRVAVDTATVVTRASHHEELDGEDVLVPKFWMSPIDGSTPAEPVDLARDGWFTNEWGISRGTEPQYFALRRRDQAQRILDVADLDDPQNLREIETTAISADGIVSAHWSPIPGRLIYYTATEADSYTDNGTVSVSVVDTQNNDELLVDHLVLGEGRFECEMFEKAPEKVFCTSLNSEVSFNSVTSMISLDEPTSVVELFEGSFGIGRVGAGFTELGPDGRYLYFQREVDGAQVINRLDFDNPTEIERVLPAQGQQGQLHWAKRSGDWVVWSIRTFDTDVLPVPPTGQTSQTLYGARFNALDAPIELARGAEDEEIFGPSFSWDFVAN